VSLITKFSWFTDLLCRIARNMKPGTPVIKSLSFYFCFVAVYIKHSGLESEINGRGNSLR
jgi:hypothetical protein